MNWLRNMTLYRTDSGEILALNKAMQLSVKYSAKMYAERYWHYAV